MCTTSKQFKTMTDDCEKGLKARLYRVEDKEAIGSLQAHTQGGFCRF